MLSEGRQKEDNEYGCHQREDRKDTLSMGAMRRKSGKVSDYG